jgi:hypothetical protein
VCTVQGGYQAGPLGEAVGKIVRVLRGAPAEPLALHPAIWPATEQGGVGREGDGGRGIGEDGATRATSDRTAFEKHITRVDRELRDVKGWWSWSDSFDYEPPEMA